MTHVPLLHTRPAGQSAVCVQEPPATTQTPSAVTQVFPVGQSASFLHALGVGMAWQLPSVPQSSFMGQAVQGGPIMAELVDWS